MDWRTQHGEVIKDFLQYLNKCTDKYVLKGGTALAQCYQLNRFSEDIDLDGKGSTILDICEKYCNLHGYKCRIAKDTDTVKRAMIHYDGAKPLKVEMSARKKVILPEETIVINGIKTYTIDILAILKAGAYQQRDKIRDLFDVVFIINNYYDTLSLPSRIALENALEFKGVEHFDYIVNNQQDELIDVDVLAENFLYACEKCGRLLESSEVKELSCF